MSIIKVDELSPRSGNDMSRQVHWAYFRLKKTEVTDLKLSDKVEVLTFPPPKNQNDLCFTYAFTHEFHRLVADTEICVCV